jgi:hypothetical protein
MANVSPLRVIFKAALLFVILNVVYYVIQPINLLNRVTVYNLLTPGRERLPFSEYPTDSYSITLTNLDQMLASHQLAQRKTSDEYRVIMLGDSSVWGYLLNPNQTQASCINQLALTLPSGRKVRVYNLGYPTLTVMKDLLILRHALPYQPDLIVWATSLASLYPGDQLDFEVVKGQYAEVAALIEQYHFNFEQWPKLSNPTWLDRTLWGQRRELADWLRYQLYGLSWASTGIDHAVPKFITPHPVNLVPDANPLSVNVLHTAIEGKISPEDLSLDVINAGIDMATTQHIPVLIVNEPIYRSSNSDLRWNTYYPKWAYDSYRTAIQQTATKNGWHYVDFWDAAPPDQFTDTDFHLTPDANCAFAAKLSEPIMALASQ